jgi:CubicO group peptidase (beta-lactamase class C family)
VRLLSPRSVKLMSTNQVGTLHSTTGLGWGLGFETTDRYGANGMQGEGSFGWAGAYGSTYRVDPEARLTLILMIQQIPNGTDIQQAWHNLIYQALQ